VTTADREHVFAFESEEKALLFVRRLCLTLVHLAIFRVGKVVKVVDGSDRGQATEIARLAKMSGMVPAS
jgi:hypothetical protein